MANKTTAINTVKKFVEDCRSSGVPVISAWLFGSYAKGKPHKYSDIEVHHFNTNVFQKNDPFINEIKRTGIEIKI